TASTVNVRDYATFRGRAGWETGRFLPYAFVGLAVVRADVSRSVTATVNATDTTPPPNGPKPPISLGPVTAMELKQDAFGLGGAVGLGVDVRIWSNIFMRAEWEYIKLGKFQDQTIHLNNVRAALGATF